jgi:chromosome segregation ATPase
VEGFVMNRVVRVLAIALALAFSSTAVRAQQLERVQRALGGLQQSAAALDQNDRDKAVTALEGMKSTVEALRGDVVQFRDRAGAGAKKSENELLAVISQKTTAHQAMTAAQTKVNDLPHKIKGLEAAHGPLEAKRLNLVHQRAEQQEEVVFRNECASRFMYGIWWSVRCTKLGWEDLVGGRWSHLNSEIQRNQAELQQSNTELGSLRGQLNGSRADFSRAQEDLGRATAEEEKLQRMEGGLRAMVVNLNDAIVFWNDMLTLVDLRLGSPIEDLKSKVKKLVGKTQETASAPTFSTYDGKKILRFQDTLKEFAQTLDNKTNILLQP